MPFLKILSPEHLELRKETHPLSLRSQIFKLKPGFSLIEILLYLLMVLALVTILFSAAGTYMTSRRSNLQSIAAKIASGEIETLRKTDFSSLPGTGPISDSNLSKLPSGSATRNVSDYQSDPKIKMVTISVNWIDQGIPKELKMDTLISENGL